MSTSTTEKTAQKVDLASITDKDAKLYLHYGKMIFQFPKETPHATAI